MLLVRDIRLPLAAGEQEAVAAALKKTGLPRHGIKNTGIAKLSVDARHGRPSLVYTVALELADEGAERSFERFAPYVSIAAPAAFTVHNGTRPLAHSPVVCGFGPAGLFAALLLARQGFRPIVLERGPAMEQRAQAVERFNAAGLLDENANIQFGEGGAGTFSDGKLTTRINDPLCAFVTRTLLAHGAPRDIAYKQKPHIGTDALRDVIVSIRREVEALGGKVLFNTPLTGNVTVYAHWVGNGYTVRFAGNGATGGGTPDQAFQYNIGQNLHRNGFVRDGYTFTGWKRADNQQAYGDGQWVTNLTTQPNGIVTMVAQWSANEAHIRYNPNPPAGKTTGGQGTPNWDGHTGDTPTIGQNGWTIDGYTFAGWATSPDGSGARYAPGARWTANGTLTLYAQWTAGQASLTYDGNGATGGKTDPQTGKTDEKINVRDNGFTRDGYTFVTWNTQADCKGNAVKPNSEWTLRGSSTLYACWAGNAQTLTYHGNGATGGNTAAQSGKTGDELTTNANGFTRDGYTFVRWDTAKDGSGTAYGEGKNGVSQYVMKPAGNDLYAIWKANPATIQYRNDWPNTTGSTPDTTGNTGDTVTISQNSFDRPGYTFTGWSTSKRGDPSLQPGDKHTLEPRTTTVWAQWKADPAHLVYNSNIGTVGSETKTVDGVVDQTVKTITNPFDRPGYTFSGWNTQADGKGKAYATGADYVLTANDKSTPKNTSVLYAQWKINGASLKFNPNGGIGHVDDVTGDAFSTVTIPGDAKEPKITRPGYRFVGWSTEKIPPAGSTFLQPGEGKVTLPAEGSTTVYAQWEPSLTTLPFTGGQAQVPTIWLYAGFALMLIALGVMMPMLRMRMAATKRTGKHMPITGGKHAK